MKKRIIIRLTGVVVTVAVFLLINHFKSKPSGELVEIGFIRNREEVFVLAEVARTAEERRVGLSFRQSLPKNQGMLFVFDGEVVPSFWMKDTLIPLDLIFI